MVGDARTLGLRLRSDSRTASFRLDRLCQRDDAGVSEGAIVTIPITSFHIPFLFLTDHPLSPFLPHPIQAPSPVVTTKNARMNGSIPHITPSAIHRKNNTSLALLTRHLI
jgi:hypothetical protein